MTLITVLNISISSTGYLCVPSNFENLLALPLFNITADFQLSLCQHLKLVGVCLSFHLWVATCKLKCSHSPQASRL